MIRVFIRCGWRWKLDRHGLKTKVPNSGGRRTTLAWVDTPDEARAICKQYNDTHNPGPLSRMAEFEAQ